MLKKKYPGKEDRKKQLLVLIRTINTRRGALPWLLCIEGSIWGCWTQGIDTAAVNLHTNWDGSITVLSSMAEIGMGGHSMLKNIVHEVLGLNKNRISISLTDTDYCPNSGPIVATRGVLMSGNACKIAAEQMLTGIIGEERLCPCSYINF